MTRVQFLVSRENIFFQSEQIIRNVGKSNKKELPADWKLHPVQTSDADDKKTNIFDIFRFVHLLCSVFNINYSFLFNCSLFIFIVHFLYLMLIVVIHCLLFIVHCSLLIAHYSLFIAHCSFSFFKLFIILVILKLLFLIFKKSYSTLNLRINIIIFLILV